MTEVILAILIGLNLFGTNSLSNMPIDLRYEVMQCVEVVEETDTDAELYILAHVINGEAGSVKCSTTLRYYVGGVVLNRVKSNDFPDTIKSVVMQEGQYSCVRDGNYNKEPSEECWIIAYDLLYNGTCLPDNVIFQAQVVQGSGVYVKEQNMYFCYK